MFFYTTEQLLKKCQRKRKGAINKAKTSFHSVQIIFVGFVEGLKSVAPWAKAQSSLGRGHPWGWWVWNQQSRVFKAPEGGGLCLEVTLGLWVFVLQSRIKTLPPCTMKKDRRRENVRYYCPYNLPVRLEMRIISDWQTKSILLRGKYFVGY